MDDGVEEAFFEEEFGALEAFGEFLANGLLDDAGSGEANEGAGFGDVEVAEHGEAGGDAAGGGVGEDADVGDAGLVELREGGRDFGHLHKADDAFHHACSAGCGDDNEGLVGKARAIDGAGDSFPDDCAHGAADEGVFHGADDDRVGAQLADGVENCVVEAGFFLSFAQALLVRLEVNEIERVSGAEAAVDELVAGFEKEVEALARADFEMILALGADVEVGLEIGIEDSLAAAGTLCPEAFGADSLLFVAVVVGAFELAVFSFEPGHRASVIVYGYQGSGIRDQGSGNRDQGLGIWD